jgi:hypothetical protein
MTTFENITKTRQKATKNSNANGSLNHTHGSTNHKRKEGVIATADEILQKGLEIDCIFAKIKKQKRRGEQEEFVMRGP